MRSIKYLLLMAAMLIFGSAVQAGDTVAGAAADSLAVPATTDMADVFVMDSDSVYSAQLLPDGNIAIVYMWDKPAVVYYLSILPGQKVLPGRETMILDIAGRSKAHVKVTVPGTIVSLMDGLAAAKIIEEAKIAESIGCFGLLLECIPAELAKKITESVSITKTLATTKSVNSRCVGMAMAPITPPRAREPVSPINILAG